LEFGIFVKLKQHFIPDLMLNKLSLTCKSVWLMAIMLLASLSMYATHNRAGEITYRQLSKYTYEITLITYTDSRSTSADRPTITLTWGDNNSEDVKRSNQDSLSNNTNRNVYIKTHTYPGPGTYTIQFLDPNRVADIVNMANSIYVPFYVESQLQINPTVGADHSPLLLRSPIDFAEVGQVFIHNPNAYDEDGDSLSFTLIPPKQAQDKDVPGYSTPKSSASFTLDVHSGQLTWDAPVNVGIYNIAILVDEYRHGVRIGYIIRDMQIIVNHGGNHPPAITKLMDTCVEAGKGIKLQIPVFARDRDAGQVVSINASGGPFQQNISPATFNTASGIDSVFSEFEWNIKCEHIRKQPYSVVFKAIDNDRQTPLADIKFLTIKVVGPAPLNLNAKVLGSAITLSWQPPPVCDVKGYFIYRRADSARWKHSYCETGVPSALGFKLIDTVLGNKTFLAIDSNGSEGLAPGVEYCYLVTAVYLNPGQYDFVEGYASNQVCARLNKDVPVITNVSIRTTDNFKGSIIVAWSKPSKLDTLKQPGPYRYIINRMRAGDKSRIAGSITGTYFGNFKDTIFVDSGIDTRTFQYTYKISFQNTINGELRTEGKTVSASSVFLSVKRGDHRLFLNWKAKVPWQNYTYVVYRKVNKSVVFDSIFSTTATTYTDTGLKLGYTYCYRIKSIGTYASPGFVDPIINYSEMVCAAAKDTIPPCPLLDSALADCELRTTNIGWTIPQVECNGDVVAYKIYFSKRRTNNFTLVDSVPVINGLNYKDEREELHSSLAGCYYVTAVDSFGNESAPSNQSCVDNCPIYKLPNVFTPGDDKQNDLFGPLTDYRFIESVDMKIYNRWGMLVFRTSDPAIRWDGRDMKTGQALAAGTYFYICSVNEIFLDKIKKIEKLEGTITLIR
jgi:gliding motility-associated-like protein